MESTDIALMRFFEKRPAAFPLFQAFHRQLCRILPNITVRVQKTQITYAGRHVFACVSFARVAPKAALPDPYLVVTLGLPAPLFSPRVFAQTEPYPGRWTNHIVLGSAEEADGELMLWAQAAYAFSERK